MPANEAEGLPQVELIVVPYEVHLDDTPMARGPHELRALSFDQRLRDAGFAVQHSLIRARVERGREAILASVALETGRAVARARTRGRFPLILSGGCLTALGVTAGLQRAGRRLSILWVDAHGDFNTPESSPSGYLDGMALAAVCGRALDEVYRRAELRPVPYNRIAHLGGRAFDPPESEDFERLRVLRIGPSEVGEKQTPERLRRCIGGSHEIYLHVDLDGLDPRDTPAVNFPEPNGIRLADLLGCLRQIEPTTALTLAGFNFERVDDARGRQMVENCARLAIAIAARESVRPQATG